MAYLWRTLAEAAAWLEDETGKAWSDRDVLRAVIAAKVESDRYLPIAFPAGDACIRCELFAPKSETPSYFVPSTLLSLGVRQADEILVSGATLQSGGELYGRPNYRWLGTDSSIEIGLDDLCIAEQTLRALVSEPAAMIAAAAGKPNPRQSWQEDAILEAISTLGLNRKSLAVPSGKPGAKAEIRTWVRKRDGLAKWSESVFNKAWRRLIESDSIGLRRIK